MPFHLLTLDALFATYPSAKVIFVHRWVECVHHVYTTCQRQLPFDPFHDGELGQKKLNTFTMLTEYTDRRSIWSFVAVILFRDPFEVVSSWCKLEAMVQDHFLVERDSKLTVKNGLDVLQLMINRASEFRRNNPHLAERFVDVCYSNLIADPIATVKQIYGEFGWTLGRCGKNRMWTYLMNNRKLRPLLQREAEAAKKDERHFENKVKANSNCREVQDDSIRRRSFSSWTLGKLGVKEGNKNEDEELPASLSSGVIGMRDEGRIRPPITPLCASNLDPEMIRCAFSGYTEIYVKKNDSFPEMWQRLRTMSSFVFYQCSKLMYGNL